MVGVGDEALMSCEGGDFSVNVLARRRDDAVDDVAGGSVGTGTRSPVIKPVAVRLVAPEVDAVNGGEEGEERSAFLRGVGGPFNGVD